MARRSLTTHVQRHRGLARKELCVRGSALAVCVLQEYARDGWAVAAGAVVASLPSGAVVEAPTHALGGRRGVGGCVGEGAGALHLHSSSPL